MDRSLIPYYTEAHLANPNLDAETLRVLAQERPDLVDAIHRHPNWNGGQPGGTESEGEAAAPSSMETKPATHTWAYPVMVAALAVAAVLLLWPMEARGAGRAIAELQLLPALGGLVAAWIVAMAGIVWPSRILRVVGALGALAAGAYGLYMTVPHVMRLISWGFLDYLFRVEMPFLATTLAAAVATASAAMHLIGARRQAALDREASWTPGNEPERRPANWAALAATVLGTAAMGAVFYGQSTSYLPDYVAEQRCAEETQAKVAAQDGAGKPYSVDLGSAERENMIQRWTLREMTYGVVDTNGLTAGTAQCSIDGNLFDQAVTVNVTVN